MMKALRLLFTPKIALAGAITLMAMPVSATMISGSATLLLGNGTVTVTGNGVTNGCIDWLVGGVADNCSAPGSFTVGSNLGGTPLPFVAGSTGTIQDIVYNASFPLTNFVVVNGVSFDLVGLRKNGPTQIGTCTAPGDQGSGATCIPAGSPFVLQNGIAGAGGVSTVNINFTVDLQGYTGTKSSGFTNYTGFFSTASPVVGTIDTILNNINAGGSVTTAWTASFMPVAAIPEPASMFLLGAGLVGFGLLRKKLVKQ